MNKNNKIGYIYLFEEDLGNNDKISDTGKLFDNYQSSEIISFSSYSIICNNLYEVIKNNNEKSTCLIGIILEMKKVIISKNNNNLTLDQLVTHFKKFKHTFMPSKKNWLFLIEPRSILSNHRKGGKSP